MAFAEYRCNIPLLLRVFSKDIAKESGMKPFSAAPCGFLLIIIIFPALVFSQTGQLPDSPQGKIVRSYLDAFNSSDESRMKEFIESMVAPDALKERPVDQRMARYRDMKADIRSITLKKVVKVSDNEIAVTARNGAGGDITLSFGFTLIVPVKLAALRIEMGEQNPVPAGLPLTEATAIDSMKIFLRTRTTADLFSGVVLVAKNSAILFEHAYGEADKRWKTPNTIDTKFNLGSINKFFTRLAIGQLAEQGKLSLNDTVI